MGEVEKQELIKRLRERRIEPQEKIIEDKDVFLNLVVDEINKMVIILVDEIDKINSTVGLYMDATLNERKHKIEFLG